MCKLSCLLCNEFFTTLNFLKQHWQAFHESVPVIESSNPGFYDSENGNWVSGPNEAANVSCLMCCQQFSSIKSLKQHLEIVHRAGPDDVQRFHYCPDCGRQFKRRDHMARHRKLSCTTGTVQNEAQRFYSCPDCEKFFKRREHLTRHQKNSCSGSKSISIFSCSSCYFRSRSEKCYQNHMRKKHPDQSIPSS